MTSRRLRLGAAVILGGTGMVASAATLSDDFEGYALGSFPAAQWLDAARAFSRASAGHHCNASFGHRRGHHQRVRRADAGAADGRRARCLEGHPCARPARFERLARGRHPHAALRDFDAANAGSASDRTMQLTFAQTGIANFANAPRAGLYTRSLTHRWRFFLISSNAGPLDHFDLRAVAALDTWYTVSLNADATTGNFHSVITDALSGTLLVDQTHGHGAWQQQYAADDAIAFVGGETAAADPAGPGSTTIAGLAQVDNVKIQAIPMPEPATWALMATGLDGWVAARRRQRR